MYVLILQKSLQLIQDALDAVTRIPLICRSLSLVVWELNEIKADKSWKDIRMDKVAEDLYAGRMRGIGLWKFYLKMVDSSFVNSLARTSEVDMPDEYVGLKWTSSNTTKRNRIILDILKISK